MTNATLSTVLVENKEDLQKAFEIRRIVFVEEQKVPLEEEFDEFEDSSHHFLAVFNGMPVGAARWRTTENGVKLERYAVLKEGRGHGVGSSLVQATLDHINSFDALKNKKKYLHAQLEAQRLYAKFGFEPYGEQFDECGIQHQAMKICDK